jgi:hypothetical protein
MNILLASAMTIVLASVGQSSTAGASASNAVPNAGSSDSPPTPAFNCARAKSNVEHLICNTPELSKLDAQLGNIFLNSSGQAGLDAKALRRDEDQWLLKVRDVCTDVVCLKTAYQQRIEAMKDHSLRAASPAAYAQTRPFPANPSLLATIRAFVGKPCDLLSDPSAAAAAGFSPVKGFAPVIANGASAHAFAKQASRFEFLFATGKDDSTQCRIADVVVLPGPDIANALLQCNSPIEDPSASTGIGMRLVGKKKLVAYWAIDTERSVLNRIPLDVLDVANTMKCQEPETGE